ncbi:MAG: hypothetical protein JXB48_21625 [Candidatus Latescibacteria bacterium]|nr:hypothetical protein [Candidatus Latescibacterota bacterium]
MLLFSKDPVMDGRSFCIPLSIAMIAGLIAGGTMLSVVPAESFDLLLAVVIFLLETRPVFHQCDTTIKGMCFAASLH